LPATVVILLCGFGLHGQHGIPPPQPALSLDEVLARMAARDKARAESLQGYSSVRRYALVNKRFGTTAEIRARLTFQSPADKVFEVMSEHGSKVIRSRVLERLMKTEQESMQPDVRASTAISPANYRFRLLGTEIERGRARYVLEAEPKKATKYLFRGRIWVDAEDFAIARIEGAPAQSPSFMIRRTAFVHRYEKFGQYWLPVSNASTSDVRVFGKTEVTVDYADYTIRGAPVVAAAGEALQ
jgi:hypothetical protein